MKFGQHDLSVSMQEPVIEMNLQVLCPVKFHSDKICSTKSHI